MSKRLLDRQVSLIEHLTSTSAIYGNGAGAPPSETPHGIDPGLLRIEARFSHEKRMEKIAAVFPMTFELLDAQREAIVPDFVDACPPSDISRIENACQFYEFLTAHRRPGPPLPAHLLDVAACELACAKVRVAAENSSAAAEAPAPLHATIRRRPGIVLLRCAFDVRSVFESRAAHRTPVERETLLAVVVAPDTGEPSIVELAPEVFDLLTALDNWTDMGARNGSSEATALIADLADAGLLEVRH